MWTKRKEHLGKETLCLRRYAFVLQLCYSVDFPIEYVYLSSEVREAIQCCLKKEKRFQKRCDRFQAVIDILYGNVCAHLYWFMKKARTEEHVL